MNNKKTQIDIKYRGYWIVGRLQYWPMRIRETIIISLSFNYYFLLQLGLFGIGIALEIYNLSKDDTAIKAIEDLVSPP